MRLFFAVRLLREFCDHSTIHAVRYFTERGRHWSERLFWLVAFGLSVYLCSWSIQNIWTKWSAIPVLLKFAEREIPISSIPFPSVTVCPQTKFLQHKLDIVDAITKLHKAPGNLSEIEFSRLEALLNLCPSSITFAPSLKNKKYSNASIYETIEDIAPLFEKTFHKCWWKGKTRECSSMFIKTFTENGLCFVFNALNSREMYTHEMSPDLMTNKFHRNISNWNFETGYINDVDKWHYPSRVYNAKKNEALQIVLNLPKDDIEFICTGIIQGFRVTLTTPGEMSHVTGRFYEALLSERTEIALIPKLIIGDMDVLRYTPQQRQCFYNSERRLRFFKQYTKSNCESECLSNFTRMECNCVKFSMPRDKATKICGLAKIRCYKDAEEALFGEDIIDGLKDVHAKQFREKCNCLSSCTNILYDVKIDRMKFDWTNLQKAWSSQLKDFDGFQPAVLSIHFELPEVVTLERTVSQTLTDFLAVCGGLLGLFLGISLLSIIEFIYYSTLRLFWTIRQAKTKTPAPKLKRKMMESIKMNYASRTNQRFVQHPYTIRSTLNQAILDEITPNPFQIEQKRGGFRSGNEQKIK